MIETSNPSDENHRQQQHTPIDAKKIREKGGKLYDKARLVVGTLRELVRYRHQDQLTREELEEFQQSRLAQLRNYAVRNSPFYQEYYKGCESVPFDELPLIDKKQLRDYYDQFLTNPNLSYAELQKHVEKGGEGKVNGYEVIGTSGSTGEPMIFPFNAREWKDLVASLAWARECSGLKVDPLKKSPMSVVATTNPLHLSARVGTSADTPFIPTQRMDAATSLPEIIKNLNQYPPEVIVTYPSIAIELARAQRRGKLDIRPKKIIVSAEVLTPGTRKYIENTWGKGTVFNLYAATETGAIAAQRPGHEKMHLLENLVHVENVDKDGNPVPEGQFGDKLLVTPLRQDPTLPLIRYEISDSVKLGPPTKGLPYRTIEEIQGRQEDIMTINGHSIHPRAFDFLDVIPSNGFRVIQQRDSIKIIMVKPQQDLDVIARKTKQALQDHGVDIPVYVEEVDNIPKIGNNKQPLIQALKE